MSARRLAGPKAWATPFLREICGGGRSWGPLRLAITAVNFGEDYINKNFAGLLQLPVPPFPTDKSSGTQPVSSLDPGSQTDSSAVPMATESGDEWYDNVPTQPERANSEGRRNSQATKLQRQDAEDPMSPPVTSSPVTSSGDSSLPLTVVTTKSRNSGRDSEQESRIWWNKTVHLETRQLSARRPDNVAFSFSSCKKTALFAHHFFFYTFPETGQIRFLQWNKVWQLKQGFCFFNRSLHETGVFMGN